jgi:hypothetical protein
VGNVADSGQQRRIHHARAGAEEKGGTGPRSGALHSGAAPDGHRLGPNARGNEPIATNPFRTGAVHRAANNMLAASVTALLGVMRVPSRGVHASLPGTQMGSPWGSNICPRISSIASNFGIPSVANPLLYKGFGGARGIRTLDPSYPGYRISSSCWGGPRTSVEVRPELTGSPIDTLPSTGIRPCAAQWGSWWGSENARVGSNPIAMTVNRKPT